MTKSNLADLSWQLLTALDHVHRNKICHRDVKPDNIIIRSRGESTNNKYSETRESGFNLTLIDFNVAVSTHGGPIDGDFGVKEWSAPETRSKSTYSEVSDMWSYACVLFFMYTGGQEMFEGGPIQETIEQKLGNLGKLTVASGVKLTRNEIGCLRDLLGNLFQINPDKRLTSA